MSAGQFKQFCSDSNRSSSRASYLIFDAVCRRFSSTVFQFKNVLQEHVQPGFPRFHERQNFAGRMLIQLFTTDSLDRPFIQGLFRRLHPGGTIVKWMLSTFVKPDSVDTIFQQQAYMLSTLSCIRSLIAEDAVNCISCYFDGKYVRSIMRRFAVHLHLQI